MAGTRGSQERHRFTPNDFIFGRAIGEGSFSTVYLAKDVKTQREYAIKVCEKRQILKEKKTKYIHQEKEILMLLTHNWNPKVPFFVRLHATFQDETSLYFVLTYAKNGDLFKFIKKMADKAIDCIQFYAGETVAAIEWLHKKGIIHRDLKPENLLLTARMHILLTDFGSAKIISEAKRRRRRTGDNREEVANDESGDDVTDDDDDDDEDDETAAGNKDENKDKNTADEAKPKPKRKRRSFVGTAEYVSPELVGHRPTRRASDLWAIGCILYQMVTGIPPFQSPSDYIIFKKIERLEYTFHEGFDENAKDLIRRLLVLKPEDRLGARDRTYYTSLRAHPFFNGLNFETLHESTPASVSDYLQGSDTPDPVWLACPDAKPGVGRLTQLICKYEPSSSDEELLHPDSSSDVTITSYEYTQTRSSRAKKPVIQQLTDEERADKIKLQALTNSYHKFVEGHLILKQGILGKKRGLFAKRRMFLLTEGPHLYYVDPSAMVLKGEIPWSASVRVEIRDFRIFFVHVPGRTYYLIDPDSTSKDWCSALEEVKEHYFGGDKAESSSSSVSSTTKTS